MTAMPRDARVLISSRTCAVWETPSAAVGSSMMTSLESRMTARATAIAWRWPPESDPTSWRTDLHRRHGQVLQRLLGGQLHLDLVEDDGASSLVAEVHVLRRCRGCRRAQGPDRRSRCRARSPSRGECEWTSSPFQKICPADGVQMPAIVLMSVDLPAPLSPMSAVTWPARHVEIDALESLDRAEVLAIPRRLSRESPTGSAPESLAEAGPSRVTAPPDGLGGRTSSTGCYWLLVNAVRRAVCSVRRLRRAGNRGRTCWCTAEQR